MQKRRCGVSLTIFMFEIRETGTSGTLPKGGGKKVGLWNALHVGDEPYWQPTQRNSDTENDRTQIEDLLHVRLRV
jgi:hypothetical protein